MKTAILSSENNTTLKTLVRSAKKMGIKARIVSDQELEDFILGKLIDEADKEKGAIKVGDPIQFLKKHGAPL